MRLAGSAAVVAVLISGCGTAGDIPATTTLVGQTAFSRVTAAPLSITTTINTLESIYRSGPFSRLNALFRDPHLAYHVWSLLSRWRNEGVQPLSIRLVYGQRQPNGRYVATLKFSSDVRATPQYFIWQFDTSAARALIERSVDGISGDRFTTAHWSVTRSPHFVIYHSPYQLAGADRSAVRDLENQRLLFSQKFSVRLPNLTAFFLYPETGIMDRLTGQRCGASADNIGCASPFDQPPVIHSSVWPTFHEPIHVYEKSLAPPVRSDGVAFVAPLFIAEGTAVALENKQANPNLSDYCSDLKYAPLNDCARIAVAHTKPLEILSDVGFNRAVPSYAYSLGGSFVQFLIDRYGYRAFGRFYYTLAAQPKDRRWDYDVAARAAFHLSTGTLIQKWTGILCRTGCY